MKLRYCLAIVLVVFTTAAHADQLFMARVNQDFPEAMLRLQETIKNSGYTVSRVQRVDIGLTKSGYKTDKYRVVFYGKSDEVRTVSAKYPQLVPYLPLKIAIFAEGEDTILIAANPTILEPEANAELQGYLNNWSADLRKIMDTMKVVVD